MFSMINRKVRLLFGALLLAMFLLLASFYYIQPRTVEASSCGTVYLYHAVCTSVCVWDSGENKTTCYGHRYDHYTAPPANRWVGSYSKTFNGQMNPTGCPTFCAN
jgi:hypothetical protein